MKKMLRTLLRFVGDLIWGYLWPYYRADTISALDCQINGQEALAKSLLRQLRELGVKEYDIWKITLRWQEFAEQYRDGLAFSAGTWPERRDIRQVYVDKLGQFTSELRRRVDALRGEVQSAEASSSEPLLKSSATEEAEASVRQRKR